MSLIRHPIGAALCRAGSPLLVVILGFAAAPSARADRIVLHNLKIIADRAVVSFDEDGVRLDDGSLIGWQDIEQAKVAADKQAAFDRLLGELGDPLFRIRQRLRVGDYKDLAPHAEAVYPRYAQRQSPTAYMVMQATMWSRIATGRREAAVEPYLRCFQYLRSRDPDDVVLPGDRRLAYDPQTGMAAALPPVWFDAAAAREALEPVARAAAPLDPRPDGVYVYYATLALAAGQPATADVAIRAIRSNRGTIGQLRNILAAQQEVASGRPGVAVTQLESALTTLTDANRPLALYWLGLARLRDADPDTRRRGLLTLLRIPALYGGESPELAAAALFHGMQTLAALDDARGSIALRNELLVRYGQTYFAMRAQARPSDDLPEETP